MTTHVKTHAKKDKIHEALDLLNDAAVEKKEEVHEALNAKYDHLKEMFSGAVEHGQEVAAGAKKNFTKALQVEQKKIKGTAVKLNRNVHQNPWKYIGGAALGSLFLGMFLKRKKG